MGDAEVNSEQQTLSIEDRMSMPDWVDQDTDDEPMTEEDIAMAIAASSGNSLASPRPIIPNNDSFAVLEESLIAQMNAAHSLALRLMATAEKWADDATTYPETMNQLLAQAQRLMKIYQQGVETLSKVRRNGTQTVNVQHIHLADESRAIVNSLTRGLPGGKA